MCAFSTTPAPAYDPGTKPSFTMTMRDSVRLIYTISKITGLHNKMNKGLTLSIFLLFEVPVCYLNQVVYYVTA